MNITDKNLNLLPIFCAVWEEGNLSKAAKRLGVSQPALSHSLAKLRDLFGDPLFARVPHGLAATRRADEIYPDVKRLLSDCERVLTQGTQDIASVTRTFVFGATTYFEMRVIGSLMKSIAEHAPGISLSTISLQGNFPKDEMDRGEVDLAVGAYFIDLPQGYRQQLMDKDPHVCLLRRGHPFLKGKRRLSEYLEYKHVVIAVPPTGHQSIDTYLRGKGKQRNIVARLNNFVTAPQVVSTTDYILTCPSTLARQYAEWFNLEICSVPVPVEPVQARMVWHERHHRDPTHKWIRDQIASIVL